MIVDTWRLYCPTPAKASAVGEISLPSLIASAVTPAITGLIQIRRKNLRTPSKNLCLYYNIAALGDVDELH